MHMVSWPAHFPRTASIAANVSAVSPDWLTEITSVRRSISGSRYLNSEELSVSQGIRASDSIQYRPIIAACKLVPIPTSTMRSTAARASSDIVKSSNVTSYVSNETLPRMASATARGCSSISFRVKCSYTSPGPDGASRGTPTGIFPADAPSGRLIRATSGLPCAVSPLVRKAVLHERGSMADRSSVKNISL